MNGDSITVIHRKEARVIEQTSGWILLYGRRKVGKTFLLRNFVDHDTYHLVRRDGSISSKGDGHPDIRDIDDLLFAITSDLERGRTVVIDEFQRLPDKIYDDIALLHPGGRLILSGSSFDLVERVISNRSPLLGLFNPIEVPLIGPCDIVKGLSEEMKVEDAFRMAPYLQDPWSIPMIESIDDLPGSIRTLRFIVPSLIGEVFTEEERKLTRTYESILALVGAGKTDLDAMATTLHDRGIISRSSSSNVIPYLKNMEKMGLVTGYRVYKSRKRIYRLTSHLMKLYYYLESRYDLEERNIDPREIAPTVDRLNDIAVEEFIADLMAEIMGGRVEILKRRDLEIDILITRRNKPILLGEVKWGRCGKADMENFKKKVERFNCRKVLITRSQVRDDEIEVLSPDDILNMMIDQD